MASDVIDRVHDRFEQLVEMKEDTFWYGPLCETIREELEHDEQFHGLVVLSERAREVVEERDSQVGYDDPMRGSIAEFGEVLDEEIHRRADEVITKVCASYVRQDGRWMVDDPDSMGSTEIQAAFDGIEQALWWLDDHEEIVERLEISYPEDKW